MVLDIHIFNKIDYAPLMELKKIQFYSSYKDRIQVLLEKIIIKYL
jgi:hypothetical protein